MSVDDSTIVTFCPPVRPARYLARGILPGVGLPLLARSHVLSDDHIPHDHDFWEVVLVLGGEGRHWTVAGEETLGAGDAFLMRPGVWHAYRACRGLTVYNCCFGVALLERELATVAEDPLLHALLWAAPLAPGTRGIVRLRVSEETRDRCREHLDALASAGEAAPQPGVAPEQIGHLVLFLTRLARCWEGALVEEEGTSSPRRLHPAVRKAIGLLEGAPAEAWTLERLAGCLYLERSYLTRLFKAATGLPPMAYLARRRAEEAARLLLRTDRSVAEIAEAVGWPDQNYFARRFRAHFGRSATEYRNRFRGGDGPAAAEPAPDG